MMAKISGLPTDMKHENSMVDPIQETQGQAESVHDPNPEQDQSVEALGPDKDVTARYPKTVLLILTNEFLERFCYYGPRAILVIYLTESLGLRKDSAVSLFHTFSMLAYVFPLFGGVIADSYLGRYKTIIYLSLVYIAGNAILTVTSLPPSELYGPMLGMAVISFGSGAIKACVGTFGGDQFAVGQETQRDSFFSHFYYMINAGALFAFLIMPILRADVHCIEDSCYPLAFGVPTLSIILATACIYAGRKHFIKVPPSESLISRVIKCIWCGASQRIKNGSIPGKIWMDHATDKFGKSFVTDVKALINCLWIFLPLPLFWALFHQQGSRWTLQAVEMNGDMGTLGWVKPDQLQGLNPVFVLLLIPVFEKIIYPFFSMIHLPISSLKKMGSGLVFCSASFCITGILHLKIEGGVDGPLYKQSGIILMNAARCKAEIRSEFYKGSLAQMEVTPLYRVSPGGHSITVTCGASIPVSLNLETYEGKGERVIIYQESTTDIGVATFPDERKHSGDGLATLSVVALLPSAFPAANVSAGLRKYEHGKASGQDSKSLSVPPGGASSFVKVEAGTYQIFVEGHSVEGVLELDMATVQTVGLILDPDTSMFEPTLALSRLESVKFVTKGENLVSMAWQVPQYLIMTSGEILCSVTSFAFAYSEAPLSMKSMVQAVLLVTIGLGDCIVIIVTQASVTSKQSDEFFMFSIMMMSDAVFFAILAYFHTYYTPVIDEGHEEEEEDILERKMVKGT